VVDLWRRTYSAIPRMWWENLETAINVMAGRHQMKYTLGPVEFSKGRMRLPNGTYVYYPQLHWDGDEGEWRWRGGKLYGARLLENIVQALARIIMTNAWLRLVNDGMPVRLTVHDELNCVVPEAEIEEWRQKMYDYLTTPPEWLPDVPLDAEVNYAKRWGDAK